MKKLIVFVCKGNIHRSVIAAACLEQILKAHGLDSEFQVDSFGLQGTKGTKLPKYKKLSDYPKEWAAAKPVLQELDIDISQHISQPISAEAIEKANVVIAIDKKVYSGLDNSLTKQFPNHLSKVHLFLELTPKHEVIKDPSGSGDKRLHREIIENIYSSLSNNFRIILNWVT